jgi:hypothetical protein
MSRTGSRSQARFLAQHRDERGQSLVIVLSLITILFLLGSALAVHASAALRATRASESQGDDFYAADAATELGIWWQRNGKAGNPPAQTINGITTSTTITTVGGGGGSCPAAPAIQWMSGFEAGQLNPAINSSGNLGGGFYFVQNGSTGNADAVSSPVRTGNYALRIRPPTPANGTYAQLQQPWGVALGPIVVTHFAVRFDTLPTQDSPVFNIQIGYSNSTWQYPNFYLWWKASTGKWTVSMGSSGTGLNAKYQESTISAVAGAWNTFDIRWTAAPQAPAIRTIDWYVDNVAQPSLSFADGTATPAAGGASIVFGQSTITGLNTTVYYDDFAVSSTSANFPIGDINISGIKPDAMGTHNTPGNFQDDNGAAINANSWQEISETPMTNNVSYIRQVTASATSYLETTFQDTTQTCIRGAAAFMAAHPDGTSANNTKTSIFDGAAETVLYSGDISIATVALSFAQRVITPGGAWSQARVNGLKLRFGYGSDINPIVNWDSFIVEVAWTTVSSSPATVTIVGTGGGSTTTTTYPDAGAGVPTLSTWTVTK